MFSSPDQRLQQKMKVHVSSSHHTCSTFCQLQHYSDEIVVQVRTWTSLFTSELYVNEVSESVIYTPVNLLFRHLITTKKRLGFSQAYN